MPLPGSSLVWRLEVEALQNIYGTLWALGLLCALAGGGIWCFNTLRSAPEGSDNEQ
jgi:hypothetical protein